MLLNQLWRAPLNHGVCLPIMIPGLIDREKHKIDIIVQWPLERSTSATQLARNIVGVYTQSRSILRLASLRNNLISHTADVTSSAQCEAMDGLVAG